MPSPFPGMDPYLEGALWTTVPFSLSAEIVRRLTPSGYDLALDYTQPPEIPLSKEDAAWVETLLRTAARKQ